MEKRQWQDSALVYQLPKPSVMQVDQPVWCLILPSIFAYNVETDLLPTIPLPFRVSLFDKFNYFIYS